MNASDVIGYVVDECSLICADCLADGEADDSPIFPGSETDSPNHCERCGELLPETLTTEGQRYVRERVWRGDGDPEVLAEWVREFRYAFPSCAYCGESINSVGVPPFTDAGSIYCNESCAHEAAEEEAEEV